MKNIQITEEDHKLLDAISIKRKTNRDPIRSKIDIVGDLIRKQHRKELRK